MRAFNRLVVILLLVGLLVLGLYTIAYSFDLFGYRLAELNISSFFQGISTYVQNAENGNLSVLAIIVLVLLALLGLVLLIAELKPSAPRLVRMEKGTYVTRGAVQDEVQAAAERTRGVLGSSTRVKARRGSGAVVNLEANVRRGDDLDRIRSEVRESVQSRLASRGIPVNKLKIKLVESDPRQTKTRVQ